MRQEQEASMNVLAAKARFDKLKFKLDAIVFNQKLLEEAK